MCNQEKNVDGATGEKGTDNIRSAKHNRFQTTFLAAGRPSV